MVTSYFKQKVVVNGKVLKYSEMLDMFEMCNTELQDRLKPARTEFKAYEDWCKHQISSNNVMGKTEAVREVYDGEGNQDWWISDNVGSSKSGYYVLQVRL